MAKVIVNEAVVLIAILIQRASIDWKSLLFSFMMENSNIIIDIIACTINLDKISDSLSHALAVVNVMDLKHKNRKLFQNTCIT